MLQVYHQHQLDEIAGFRGLPQTLKESVRLAAQVFPFKVSHYLISELIDWSRVPDDPLFRLAFPLEEMLVSEDQMTLARLLRGTHDRHALSAASNAIRRRLNPNPDDQKLNVPLHEGRPLEGVQHKYDSTVLLFPSAGQTCHSHCSFCFRWSQFTGMHDEVFRCDDMDRFYAYLAAHREVTDVLLTGGDPMIMSTARLEELLLPLLTRGDLAHIRNVRFGTKALSFWPYRFTSDRDADALLRLFESLRKAGKHVALMAHFNHPRELETAAVQEAVARALSAGAVIRTQGPILAHINDDAATWRELWSRQVALGMIPYYMFMQRDTGARDYFGVSLERALAIHHEAREGLSGLARTARGPIMSTGPGKVEILGVLDAGGERCFSLRFIQARRKEWADRHFLAGYSAAARWIDELRPAFGEPRFFFEAGA